MPFLKVVTPPKPKPPAHKCVKPGGRYDSLVGIGSLYECPICGTVWRKEGASYWEAWPIDYIERLPVEDPLVKEGNHSLDDLARQIEDQRLASS